MDRVPLQPERIEAMLDAIRDDLGKADGIVNGWDQTGPQGDEAQLVSYYVENAFIGTLVLLESLELLESFRLVKALNSRARKDYAKVHDYEGDLYLVWPEKLRHFIGALKRTSGKLDSNTVTRDVIELLRACEYVITDRKVFSTLPTSELDVHTRIEGILRAVFQDVRTKPNIDKPIKNFQPDTGLPSVKTLIEYKYVKTKADVKRVSDELLADTRGYVSKEWNQIICVVYETGRIESERKWKLHLRDCGLMETVDIIVIRGEVPVKVSRAKKEA
jgi:hypothetical protein